LGSRVQIGQLLLQSGFIDAWQLQSALGFQRKWGCRIGRAMIHLGFLSAEALMTELARQQGVRYVDVADLWVPREIVRLVPEKLIQKHGLLPIALGSETRRGPLICATTDPSNLIALDEVAFASG
jgi:type IV pilus assembly protein PilB